jgi:hypothetical protein
MRYKVVFVAVIISVTIYIETKVKDEALQKIDY